MDKMTREQFLALPVGTVYLERSAHDIGPAIKGLTNKDGSFQKRVVRPTGAKRIHLVNAVQEEQDQTEFYVFDEVEMMATKSLIFDNLKDWTPEIFQAKVLRLIETFGKMPDLMIKLPDGRMIRGDGKDISPTAQGSNAIH